MTGRVCFLFNHEDVHQIAHTLPVAQALAAADPKLLVTIAVSSDAQHATVVSMLGRPPSNLTLTQLTLNPAMEGLTNALSRIAPVRRLAILHAHRAYFQSFDALVVPEFTTTQLRSRWGLIHPKLICIPHGGGDRSVGFTDELRLFDLILVAGEKTRQRMLDRHPMLADQIKVCGYPKFDAMDLNRRPRLFDNDKPVVVYNPHFDPKLSSWYRFGPAILDYFAKQDRFNFVFAPHVMLFRKWLHGSLEHRHIRLRGDVPAQCLGLPHMLVDTGSPRSVDMTYTLAGDIYLGDVSSQIYEWIIRPRPAIFMNSHSAHWQDDPNYAHWHLGPVLSDVADLPAVLDMAVAAPGQFAAAQKAARDYTFSITQEPAAARCARAILDLLPQSP